MEKSPNASDWLTLQNPFSKISKQILHASYEGNEIDPSESIIGRNLR